MLFLRDMVNFVKSLANKGGILSRNGSGTATELTVGSDGQILSADSGEATGLKWVAQVATLTTKGDLLTRTASALARLAVGTDGQILRADSGETTGLIWGDEIGATITTKGDILTRNGSTYVRLPVGADGNYLKADSSESTGLVWASLGSTVTRYYSNSTAIAAGESSTFTHSLGSRPMVQVHKISGSTYYDAGADCSISEIGTTSVKITNETTEDLTVRCLCIG